MRRWRWLACLGLWVMIAVPYAPIVWQLSRPLGGAWPRNSLLAGIAAVVITAALGTSTFVLLGKAWFALAGGISGGLLSWVSLRLLGYFSFLPRHPDVFLEIVPWSAVAGIVTGGLWWRLRSREAGYVLDENNFLWIALAGWILVLRLGQIIVAGQLIVGDSLFIEELLVFPLVLLLTVVSSTLLYKRLKGSLGRLILLSMLAAFITQEVAALAIFPVAFLARALAGTGGAFYLLAFVPGPGLVWGAIIGYMAFRFKPELT